MSRNARNITSWIALGAMLLWSFGIDCCCLGTGCCGGNVAAAEAEGPGSCCCPAGNPGTTRTRVASQVTAPEQAARLCDCESHDGKVIVVAAKTTLSPPLAVSESPACEEFPVLVTEALPTCLLPYRFPTPSARGPPGATVLS